MEKDNNGSKIEFGELKKKFIVSIISNIVLVLVAFVPVFQTWILSDDKIATSDAKWQMKVQTKVDSMQAIINENQKKQNADNKDKIYEMINDMRKELPYSSQIWLYYTNNRISPMTLTVLYTADNIEPCLSKSYWQQKKLPKGYVWYNEQIKDWGFLYIPYVMNNQNLFGDSETIENLSCDGTNALMGIYLKEIGYSTYYISVSWQNQTPLIYNYKAKIILKNYGSQIAKLIEPKYIEI